MKKHNEKPPEASEGLRQQAEHRLHPETVAVEEMSEAEVAVLVHELRVHQVEMEMQNEELRKTQVELEQSRSRYADLFDFAPVGYLVFDADGRVVEANLTATSMLGLDRSSIVGRSFSLHVAPASRDTWRLHYSALFKTGKSQQCEIEVIAKDQVHLTVRLHSRPVLAGNKVVQCRTAMLDVTGLVRAEQRLRDSERRFRTLAENSPDIIVRIDRDLRIVYASRHVEDAVGIPAEEVIGRTLGALEAPEDLVATWTEPIQKVFGTARTGRAEFQCDSPRGLRYYSAAVAPEFDEDRTVRTVLVTIRDITDRIQAEEKYTTVIRNLQDGFCILDAEGRYLEVNDTYCRMLGHSCEDLVRMKVLDVWEPTQRAEVARHLQKTLQEGGDKFLTRHVRKDGSLVDVDVTMQRLDSDRLFVFARDVTERRIAEEKRIEALQRLELVSEATSDGIWDFDLATDTFWHNDAYLTAFGYAPEEVDVSRQWWQEHVHPQDRAQVVSSLEGVLQNHQDRWSARYRFQRKDGSYAWVMARARVLRDEQGRAVRLVGSMMDLTEKLELVDQLETERSKLATILDTALSAIIVVDERGGLSYANPAAGELTGRSMSPGAGLESYRDMGVYHLDGTPCEPDDLPLVRSALYGEMHTEEQLLVRRPDGTTRHTLVNTSPLVGREGKTTGAVAVIQDITELKQAERALREAHDRLEEKVQERTTQLDQTVATLQEEVAEKIEAQNLLLRQNEVLQKIINNIPVLLFFLDAEGCVGMINEAVTRILGYSLGDFQEHTALDLCFPEPEHRREVWEYLQTAGGSWRDFFVQDKEGEKIISSWASVRLADGSYLAIAIDIRERVQLETCVRESEQRYRTLVEMSPDAISVERDGVIQFANSTAVSLLGAKAAEEVVGRPLLDFIHPDHRQRVDRQFARLRQRRKPIPVTEEKIVRPDGTAIDIELAAMPIIFENQPANQVVLRDITPRKQVETKLRENATKLQQQAQLLDLAHDSIVVNDMEGRIVFWNRGAEQTYGWTQQEAVGKISHELLRTRFPLNLIEITAKLLDQGRWNGELTHTTRGGETIVVSTRWALQTDESGRPSGILVIDRDITQQKRAEQATIEAWRFAESVTDTIQESLLVLNQDLRVVSANQTFYRTFGVAREETMGRLIYELGNRQWDIPELRRLLEDVLPHSSSFESYEVEHDFEHIGRRTMLLNARQIYRQSQQTQMILLAIMDITLRKEQERKIQEHQRELATLTEELLLTEERERRRLALLLHDSIGQSLAFSKREIGMLQKSTPEEVRQALEYVKEQIDDAIRQTRSLTFELSPTTLHTFGLEAAVEELAEQFAQRGGFQYHFETTEEDKPLSEQIKALLYRASRELLTNISKHAQASNVFIRIDRVDESIRIIMEDDGKGFDIARLEEIIHQRQGFGLFSIRERLTHVGGAFAVESAPGQGTKVTLVAPLQGTPA
ncbi:MAG: PAS domain S-box protein [Planctomycetes bacterium]|nr:PAS domain S-box protein [Planctomycetota bacterium]